MDATDVRQPQVGDDVIYVNDLGQESHATISEIFYGTRVDLAFESAPRVTAVKYDPAGGPFSWHWPANTGGTE